MKTTIIAALLLTAPAAAFAQKWEYGAVGGFGFLNTVPVTGATGSATAGFKPGFAAGGFIGQNLYSHFSGEVRYEFMQSDLQLSSGGQKAQFTGVSHALHYDVLYHVGHSEAPVQFFGALGGGLKEFGGTGTEAAVQPLSQFGYFTKTRTVKMLLTVGAGFTCRVSPSISIRGEVKDFVSGFPTAVLTPPPGVKYGNILHELVPMVSIVYTR